MTGIHDHLGVLTAKVPGKPASDFIRALIALPKGPGIANHARPARQQFDFLWYHKFPNLQPMAMVKRSLGNTHAPKLIRRTKIVLQSPGHSRAI